LTGNIYRTREGLKQGLDNMVRFIPIKQFHVQIAPRFVGEALEKLLRQAEPELRRDVLFAVGNADAPMRLIVQPAPDEIGTPAKIDHAPCQALVHWKVRFAGPRVARIEAGSISPDAPLFSESFPKGLPERNPAVFDGVMRIDVQVALASQVKVDLRVFRQEREHMVEEGDSRPDIAMAGPFDPQF
jgi:hypothetical protein